MAGKAGFDIKAGPGGVTLTGPRKAGAGTPVKISPGMKVLVFEPNPVVGSLYRKFSQLKNVDLKLASTIEQLVESLRNPGSFQRVIVDVTALSHMKPDQFPTDVPLVLSTGLGTWGDYTRIEGMPVSGLLIKPFDLEDLARTLSGE